MKNYLGWLSILIGLGGSILFSYVQYNDGLGGRDYDIGDVLPYFHLACLVGGLVALGFRRFEMIGTKIFALVVYAVSVPVAMIALNLAINGLHLKMF